MGLIPESGSSPGGDSLIGFAASASFQDRVSSGHLSADKSLQLFTSSCDTSINPCGGWWLGGFSDGGLHVHCLDCERASLGPSGLSEEGSATVKGLPWGPVGSQKRALLKMDGSDRKGGSCS